MQNLGDDGKQCGKAYKILGNNENKVICEIKIKEDILNMIRIYIYNKDLLNKYTISKKEIDENKDNYKDIIFSEKCFLISKEKMDIYKNYCLYDELEKYLNDNITKITIKNDSKGSNYSSANIDIAYEFLQNNNFFEKYVNKDSYKIDKEMFDIKKVNISNDINNIYSKDFTIVNEDFFKLNYPAPDISNFEKELIINSGK